jgi:sec-independent protein translocase protein TatA
VGDAVGDGLGDAVGAAVGDAVGAAVADAADALDGVAVIDGLAVTTAGDVQPDTSTATSASRASALTGTWSPLPSARAIAKDPWSTAAAAHTGAVGALQPLHLVLILIIVLVIFGAGRLTEVGGQLGKGIRDFRANAEDKPQGGSAAVGTSATGFCPSCGTRLAQSDARFCQSCGATVPR